jgi:hypothetical protein
MLISPYTIEKISPLLAILTALPLLKKRKQRWYCPFGFKLDVDAAHNLILETTA